jgi:hypothetical protein
VGTNPPVSGGRFSTSRRGYPGPSCSTKLLKTSFRFTNSGPKSHPRLVLPFSFHATAIYAVVHIYCTSYRQPPATVAVAHFGNTGTQRLAFRSPSRAGIGTTPSDQAFGALGAHWCQHIPQGFLGVDNSDMPGRFEAIGRVARQAVPPSSDEAIEIAGTGRGGRRLAPTPLATGAISASSASAASVLRATHGRRLLPWCGLERVTGQAGAVA